MKLSVRAAKLPVETAFNEGERMLRAGIPFINFAWGDPDQPSPEAVKNAACQALARNETRYCDTKGIFELREAIASHITNIRKIPVTWENVIILPGANCALFLGLLATIDEGDEVICPNPGYPLYQSAIRVLGGIPVPLPLRPELNYNFNPDELNALITSRTRAIIVNSPHNPTGSLLSPENINVLAKTAAEKEIWLLSDEVYDDFVYEGKFQSVFSNPAAKNKVLLISSFSKTFAMTGWRLGYAIGPRSLIEKLGALFTQVDFSVNTFIQYGGIEALCHHKETVARMKDIYQERRDLIVSLLNTVPGIKCPVPQGSFYVFPEVSGACKFLGLQSAAAFQKYLIDECQVAVMAREWFGPCNPGENGKYIRLSYTLPTAEIVEGITRIRTTLEDLLERS